MEGFSPLRIQTGSFAPYEQEQKADDTQSYPFTDILRTDVSNFAADYKIYDGGLQYGPLYLWCTEDMIRAHVCV
jgi:hypothetical protein